MPNGAIDLVHLARQSGGDEELERELLSLFAEQCSRQVAAIAAAPDAGRRRDAAHTLKGAARAVGAWEVADAADRVERTEAELAIPDLAELRHAAEGARAMIARLKRAA